MYKITITKIEKINKTSRTWKTLRVPYVDEAKLSDEELKKRPQFGYVECPITEEGSTKVFEIALEDIDVAEVAKKIITK